MKIPAFFKKSKKAFTLIELLVVIGILAVLLAIVLIAINPARQFEQANDTQRSSDVNAILNAVHQYMVEENGQLPTGITTTETAISDTGVDLCLLVPDYIAALPVDPLATSTEPVDETACAAAYDTGYTIQATGNRVTVTAPNAEGDAAITVTR
jgi:type IV pilus assembly protein PilA